MASSLVPLAAQVQRAPKFHGTGVHRTVSARETCQRVAPVLSRIGASRLADITGLDHLGIPVYSCIRPSANRVSVSVTCGKGTSRAHARAGAIMEAIEYYCAEPGPQALRRQSFENLCRSENALDPADLILPGWSPYRPDRLLEWLPSWNLVTGETCWVPANAVLHPYLPDDKATMILRANTNGLASGNVMEEAICHGLAELIERDSWSLCWVKVKYGGGDLYPGVNVRALSGPLRWLIERFREERVRLHVRDITSELGVPAYYAASFEELAYGYLAHEGMGAHPDPSIALARALTEVAQSRAADIQGSREDLAYWRRRAGNGKAAANGWAFTQARRDSSLCTHGVRHSDIRDDIAWMVGRLACHGLQRILVVDLTQPRVGVPVVRVIVPGLEYAAIDEYRVGPRCRHAAEQTRQKAGPRP